MNSYIIEDYFEEEDHKLVIDESLNGMNEELSYPRIDFEPNSNHCFNSFSENFTKSMISIRDQKEIFNNETHQNFCVPSTSKRSLKECSECRNFFAHTSKEIRSHFKVEHPAKAIRFKKQDSNESINSSNVFI
jgi:hypothetical protein